MNLVTICGVLHLGSGWKLFINLLGDSFLFPWLVCVKKKWQMYCLHPNIDISMVWFQDVLVSEGLLDEIGQLLRHHTSSSLITTHSCKIITDLCSSSVGQQVDQFMITVYRSHVCSEYYMGLVNSYWIPSLLSRLWWKVSVYQDSSGLFCLRPCQMRPCCMWHHAYIT